MQHWETNYTIRAPIPTSLPDGNGNNVSRELSWATDNRLLEMRSWLYQPFLYYFIHNAAIPRHAQGTPTNDVQQSTSPSLTTATSTPPSTSPPTLEDFLSLTTLWSTEPNTLNAEDATNLYHFITSGIECNLKVLDVRSLRHRHHGLWYDMRSVMTAALILLAIVKAGREAWIPGGAEILWGYDGGDPRVPGYRMRGRIGHIAEELDYWAGESPDLKRHRQVLVEVAEMVQRVWWERMEGEGV